MFNYNPFFISTTMTGSYYDTILKMCMTHGGPWKADRWSVFDQNDQSSSPWRAPSPSLSSDPLRRAEYDLQETVYVIFIPLEQGHNFCITIFPRNNGDLTMLINTQ